MKITIIDYGLSNLLSVSRAVEYLGGEPFITQNVKDIEAAEALILPGVGAFGDGMAGLEHLGFIDVLLRKAKASTPLLGICLGMQLLFDESEEFGLYKGLGLIPGRVIRIPDYNVDGSLQRVPHVGWNVLIPSENITDFQSPLFAGTRICEEVYFVHSYKAVPLKLEHSIADTLYGGMRICAAVNFGSIYGVQFHPEKSGQVGLNILRQFLEICTLRK
jgi:glutamine amidotransferase